MGVQIGEQSVPHGQLVRLVGDGIAGGTDVQPQRVGGERGPSVQLGAPPAKERLDADAERQRRAERDAAKKHPAAGEHCRFHKKTDLSAGNDIQRIGLLRGIYSIIAGKGKIQPFATISISLAPPLVFNWKKALLRASSMETSMGVLVPSALTSSRE